MNKSEEKLTSRELKKAKIRERYKGINQDEIEVIPALPQPLSGSRKFTHKLDPC